MAFNIPRLPKARFLKHNTNDYEIETRLKQKEKQYSQMYFEHVGFHKITNNTTSDEPENQKLSKQHDKCEIKNHMCTDQNQSIIMRATTRQPPNMETRK